MGGKGNDTMNRRTDDSDAPEADAQVDYEAFRR